MLIWFSFIDKQIVQFNVFLLSLSYLRSTYTRSEIIDDCVYVRVLYHMCKIKIKNKNN